METDNLFQVLFAETMAPMMPLMVGQRRHALIKTGERKSIQRPRSRCSGLASLRIPFIPSSMNPDYLPIVGVSSC